MAINISKQFLFRKLHQLSGIAPLGLFIFAHFFTNSKALGGAEKFNDAVGDLHSVPYLIFIEWLGIFIPLIYHAVYGLFITWETRANNIAYPYARNWFYTIQRTTGIIVFFFVFFHILNFRFGLIPGLNTTPVAGNAEIAFALVAEEFQRLWVVVVYVIGITATVWHLANGFWLFAVDWGIVIGAQAQRYAGYACAALGVALLATGLNAMAAFIWKGGLLGSEFWGMYR